ncbi:MAG: MFS transporter [Bifidobacteriaceae bacterium]|jgi:NNP family nitrate/nitrite transporter-like MFS transporter|nr:MFS transporter [Bifidobacteriaceae bacterium]
MSESKAAGPAAGGAEVASSPRSWAIAVVALLIGAIGTYNQILVAALGTKIMDKELGLGITEPQLSALMVAPLIGAVFLGLPSGNLGDRFGPTKVIAVAIAGTVAGTVLRIFADTYALAFVSMILIGLGAMVLQTNVAKLMSAWFKPSQIGMAVAMFMFGAAGGTGVAQATGARFGSIQAAYTFAAVVTAVAFVLFILIVRDRPKGMAAPTAVDAAGAPEKSGAILKEVLSNPQVWLVGLAMVLFMGWQMVFATFLPTMLEVGKNLDSVTAGTYASAFAFGGLTGCIVCPAVAARLGRMKPVIMTGGLLAGVSAYLAWLLAPSFGFVIFIFLSGLGGAAVSCLVSTAPALLPSVGPARAGTAGGLMGTLAPLGGYVLPSLVVVPIASGNYTLMTILGAVIIALVFVVMIGVPEYGPRRSSKKQAAANPQPA